MSWCEKMKKHDNLKSSLAKWLKIRKDVATMDGSKGDWKDYWFEHVWEPCGFCASFLSSSSSLRYSCDNCPLYPKFCSSSLEGNIGMLKMYDTFEPSKRKEVIPLIDKFIKEMKRHNKAFYEVDRTGRLKHENNRS